MDERSSKKGIDRNTRYTANTRDRNDQTRSRVGCSSTANPPKVAQVRYVEKGKSLRPSGQSSSSGKEVIGSSRRTATNPAKPLIKPRRTVTSSGLQAEKEGTESTKGILMEVGKSSGVSNLRSQRNFNQRSGLRQQENESIAPVTKAASSKYGLRNLRCNTVSDVIPSCSSSDSTVNRRKATVIKKSISEGESSSTVKGKKMTASSLEGLNSGSRKGISISNARGSRNIAPPHRDNSRASVRTVRSVGGYARGRFSTQGNENPRKTNESLVVSPISPHSIDLNSPVTEELYGMMPMSPEEYGIPHSLIIQDGSRHRRNNMDDMSEVLLALGRIERDEELTQEQIHLLETNSDLDELNIYDHHRDMRLDIDNMSYEELLALEERMGTVSTALTEEALSGSLKKSIYQSAPSDDTADYVNEDKDDIKCCICQEEYVAGDEVGRLQCTHKFHVLCIEDWLRLKNWCPFCKESAAPSNSSSSS